ncbi:RrF2 family transcriptional regulator [Candidatus Neomarinimicrobiota bacterium]
MLKITRKTEYALLALGQLSQGNVDTVTKVREISDLHQIPFPVLSKVMQNLARAGFVEPVKGAHGGYRLSAQTGDTSLMHFLNLMEGPMGIVDCFVEADCDQLSGCSIRTPMQIIDDTLRQVFSSIPLINVIGSNRATTTHFQANQTAN